MTRLRTARPRAALTQGRTDWYRLTNLADGTTDLYIYDEIGFFGVTAADLVNQLADLDTGQITVRLNSPGGEIFDGIAIHNALRSHQAKVTVQVDSLAASIASVIAMAGDEIVMAPHSQMMIHDGLGLCVGNAAAMRQMAEMLDRQSDNIAEIYKARAGGRTDSWRNKMRAETWYSAQEAVDAGLADRVATIASSKPAKSQDGDGGEDMPMEDRWDLSVFRYAGRDHSPGPYADRLTNQDEPAGEPGKDDEPDEDEPGQAAAQTSEPTTPPAREPKPEPEPAEQPDEWAAMVAHLTTSESQDDTFTRLREGLLT